MTAIDLEVLTKTHNNQISIVVGCLVFIIVKSLN